MERVTNTDKWKDSWFLDLRPSAKLVFMYLYENCDAAGFYELDSEFMRKQLLLEPENIQKAVYSMKKALVFNVNPKKRKLWMKTYLFHQKQLPLELNNPDHKKIKLLLEKNLEDFGNNEEIQFILDKVETGKKKSGPRKVFAKPTLGEFIEYGLQWGKQKSLDLTSQWCENLFNHYVSNGWKIGGKTPMVDWKAAIRKNSAKESGKGDKQSRTDKLVSANTSTLD